MRVALLFPVLTVVPLAIAAEPEFVALKKLNDDPSVFQEKIVRVRAGVSGTSTEKPDYTWLTVKGKLVDIKGNTVNKDGINFVIRSEDKNQLLQKLQDGKFTRATITATVRRQDGAWLAVVSSISLEKPPQQSPQPSPPQNEQRVPLGNIEDWTLEQLLSRYDPEIPDDKVARELEKRSKGKRFIVFSKDRSVDVRSSEFLFKELRKGFSERDWFEVDGTNCKIYKVGVGPHELFDENPLYPGEALRLDGMCEHTQRKWAQVPLSVRQVLYLARTDSKELTIEKAADAHYILDQIKDKNAAESEKWVKDRYPQAFSAFGERKERNLLPALKISSVKQEKEKAETKKEEKKEETRKESK